MNFSTYTLTRETYRALGVDAEVALTHPVNTPVSLHGRQDVDGSGVEKPNATLSARGLKTAHNSPRKLDELRQHLDLVNSLRIERIGSIT